MPKNLTQSEIELKLFQLAFSLVTNSNNLKNFKEGSREYIRARSVVSSSQTKLNTTWMNLQPRTKRLFCRTLSNLHLDKTDIYKGELTNADIIKCFESLFKANETERFFERYQKDVNRVFIKQKKQMPSYNLINKILAPKNAMELLTEFVYAERAMHNITPKGSDAISKMIAESTAKNNFYNTAYLFFNYYKSMNEHQKERFFALAEKQGGSLLSNFAKKVTSEDYIKKIMSERSVNKQGNPFEKYLRSDL